MKNIFLRAIKIVFVFILFLLLLSAAVFLFYWIFIPTSRSYDAVQRYVLRKIPIGTSYDDSVEIIDKKGWKIIDESHDYGLIINDDAENAYFASKDALEYRERSQHESRVVGVNSMYVEIGHYYAPFDTSVLVYMAFDEDNKLIEIALQKDIDAP